MLEDRYYMRRSPFDTQRSATMLLLVANVVAFLGECIVYGYPPGSHIAWGDKFALSWDGLSHGYVWQLLTFQFMHAGLLHLLFNCWAIFVFGREVEATLGVRRFLTLYFASGAIGGLVQTLAGGLAVNFFSTSQWAMRFAGPTLGASAGALGLLAAFAMLFPERQLVLLLFFIIPFTMRAKFLLLFCGLLAIFGILFPMGNIADAAHLGGILTGIVFVRYAIHWQWHWPSLRRGPRPVPRRLVRVRSGNAAAWARSKPPAAEDLPPEEFLSKEVDPILDKISAQGIQSLTERERRILQAARDKMGKR
ncbi:MAG: rhomboid family intramembrane serine protease [Limisphaerales bacterium]|nr:rhomboid family intramembrane serine protease [Verrucomicrobiae bacterium]